MLAIIVLIVLMTPMLIRRFFRPGMKVLLRRRLSNIQMQKTGMQVP
jgi:hypothetical protein